MAKIHIEQIRPELTWRLRQQELYPASALTEMAVPEDATGIHYGAFYEDWLVGVVSIFNRGTDVQFRKLAVDKAHQRKGVGTAIVKYVADRSLEEGANRLWCNARCTAKDFYLRAGFKAIGETFYKNGIEYLIMEKHLNKEATCEKL